MRYLSVCSGIEAASEAWRDLGWQCAGVSEIEKFPRAVLEQRLGAVAVDDDHRHAPGANMIPLFGDFTKIRSEYVGPIDLLVGGTPCQSFSIAGKRLGLDDPRGNLTLEFLALARRVQPRWIVWENVPGVLSHDEGRTMGTFLKLVGECGFRWAYRVLDAQYVRVGRFGRAVPQRRRRVFLVGYSGTANVNPRAVLFDRESLQGNPAPRREAGERVAPTIAARTRGGGGLGTDFDCDGGLISTNRMVAMGEYADDGVASAMKARDFKDATDLVAHALRGEGFDASEDGTGRGTPIVPCYGLATQQEPKWAENVCPTLQVPSKSGGGQPHCVAIQERAVSDNPNAGPDGKGWRDDGAAYTLEARSVTQAVAFAQNQRGELRTSDIAPQLTTGGGKPGEGYPAICFSAKDSGNDAAEEVAPTLRAGGHSGSHANAGVMPAVAFKIGQGAKAKGIGAEVECSPTLTATDSGTQRAPGMVNAWGVRRLTPRECERLMGFPDDFTKIEWRGKPAENCPDGPRYKALGNSMAVNVMCWIGERIAAVEAIAQELDEAA